MSDSYSNLVLAWPWLLLALPLPWLAARLLPAVRTGLEAALRAGDRPGGEPVDELVDALVPRVPKARTWVAVADESVARQLAQTRRVFNPVIVRKRKIRPEDGHWRLRGVIPGLMGNSLMRGSHFASPEVVSG